MSLENAFAEFTHRDWERTEREQAGEDAQPAASDRSGTPATSETSATPATPETIRLAIVGVGNFARNRALPAIAESRYCETTMLVTGSPDQCRTLHERFGIDHIVTYDAFLAGNHVDTYDAVYVATPNAFHGRYAITAADHGKHVLCEKPLETTAERAQEIVDACDDAGVTLMTAYRLQVEPAVRRTKELVADGVIGDVVQAHAGFSHPLLDHADPDTWRLDPDLAGGGALVDLGIYPLNTIRFILEMDPDSVYATTHSSTAPFDAVDEHVSFQLEFPTGATAACTASFDAHASSWLELIGTDGLISIASPFGGVVPQEMVVESGDVRMEYTGPSVDEVREEFEYFGYCVVTGTDPEPDGEDGVADLAIIEAAYESAETHCRVELS